MFSRWSSGRTFSVLLAFFVFLFPAPFDETPTSNFVQTSPSQHALISRQPQKAKIIDINISPQPYRQEYWEPNSLANAPDINITVTIDDPDQEVSEVIVRAKFHSLTSELVVEAVKDASAEADPYTLVWTVNREGNAYANLQAKLVSAGKNSAGMSIYRGILPVSQLDMFGSGGVNRIDFEIEVERNGSNLKEEVSIPVENNFIEIEHVSPAVGAYVLEQTTYKWNIFGFGKEDKLEVKICNNPEMQGNSLGIFRKCKVVKLNDVTFHISEDDAPKLSDGNWWWRVDVRSPTNHWLDTPIFYETVFRSSPSFFIVGSEDDSGSTVSVSEGGDSENSNESGSVVSQSSVTGIRINNQSDIRICTVTAKSLTDSSYAENLLDKALKTGESEFFTLPAGSYDIILKDCDDNTVYNHNGVFSIEPGQEAELVYSKSTITLQIENFSVDAVCQLHVYAKDSNESYRLGFSEPIQTSRGTSVTLDETPGRFDVELRDCAGHSLVKENSVYISNHYIVRAIPTDGNIAPTIEKKIDSTDFYIKETLVQHVIDEYIHEAMEGLEDYVELTSTPRVIFEDGAVIVRAEMSVQGAPSTTGYAETTFYINRSGVVQIDDIKITAGGIPVPIDSFKDAKDLLNDAFQEIFASVFVAQGVTKLEIDNGQMVISTPPVCKTASSGPGDCLPLEILEEFISGMELLTGTSVTVVDKTSCKKVPDVMLMSGVEGAQLLNDLGFNVSRSLSGAETLITRQTVQAGKCYYSPETVTIYLQEYAINQPGCVDIPNFVGGNYGAVEDWSEANGFNFTHGYETYDASKPAKSVLRQNPPAGYCVDQKDFYMYVWLNPVGGN